MLKPCFWIFADTKDPREKTSEFKVEDFWSRLTDGAIELADTDPSEYVYIGLYMLKQRFPQMRRVSEGIAHALKEFPSQGEQRSKSSSLRRLRELIFSMQDDQDGDVVTKRNISDATGWPKVSSERLVDIFFETTVGSRSD